MINAVIIEDENIARDMLKQLLGQYCKNLHVVGEAVDVKSGVNCIKKHNPDLVFLDIEMPDGDGFEILRRLNEINFNIIFTTAYSEFAIRAFKYSATHYLLKPIVPTELVEAVQKAEKELQNKDLEEKFRKLLTNIASEKSNKKLVLTTSTKLNIVNISEIIMCKSYRNYTQFFMEDGEKITVSKTMKNFNDILSENGFIKPHRQYMINIDHIKSFEKNNGSLIKLTRDLEVPVSSRKKEMLLEVIQQI